ncbi:uncharacterized protein Dana_GF28087 [Drosophila ananassae]|uniref:Uncharacterized protein n=1 Tax=Drosophila ananassae TaxID=7217 RepID=A0A0P8XYY3_DROAN|nr:uncharacterized protein Dana_GF28087 [Drosophila ananassae]
MLRPGFQNIFASFSPVRVSASLFPSSFRPSSAYSRSWSRSRSRSRV